MQETITIDKSVLFDLLGYVSGLSSELATVVVNDETNFRMMYPNLLAMSPRTISAVLNENKELSECIDGLISVIINRAANRGRISTDTAVLYNYICQFEYAQRNGFDIPELPSKILAALSKVQEGISKL